MKTVLISLGFVAAGLIGAVAARELLPPAAPEVPAPSGLAAIEARIDDLGAQVERLTEEVRARRDAGVLPAAPPSAVPDAPDAPEGVGFDGPDLSKPGRPAPTDDLIEEKVVETLTKIARERAAAKAQEVEAATRKRERDWLAQKQKVLGLTDYQVDEIAKMMIERRRVLTGIQRKWNAAPPEQRPQILQERKDYGLRLQGELQKLLSTDQYEGLMQKAPAK